MLLLGIHFNHFAQYVIVMHTYFVNIRHINLFWVEVSLLFVFTLSLFSLIMITYIVIIRCKFSLLGIQFYY